MANNKKTLYVGGLADDVDSGILKSAFSAFGDIIDVNLPVDYSNNKHKGFAFIEFQLPEDAADAIDNMDNSEILGKTIRVNLAKPSRHKENASRPVWADDDYLRKVGEDTAQPQVESESNNNEIKISDESDSG